MRRSSTARALGDAGTVEIIAHRGDSARAPENTLAALEAAVLAGADAVEFDLQAAADGTPVLLHDATLERTTSGSGPVADRTVAELRTLDAGGWFAPAFAGEPLPELETALRALRGRAGRVYAEVKPGLSAAALDRVVGIVAAAGMLDRTVYISMGWHLLDRIRQRASGALIGYIVEQRGQTDDGVARARGDPGALLDFDTGILLDDPSIAGRCRDLGIELACWTVDTPEHARRVLELGVRRITTNAVAELVAWKATLGAG